MCRSWWSFSACALLSVTLIGIARSQVTTVEIVHYFNVQGQQDGLAAIKSDFEAANPDIKIQYTYVPFAELLSRTLQMAAVHKSPAISCIDNPDVLRVAKAGALKDISADVAKLPTWQDTYPGPKSAVTDGQKVYGVPIGSNSLAIFYNKKMFADAGISSPPATWADLTEDAAKLTKAPVYGLDFSATNSEEATWQWEPFLWSNGGKLLDLTAAPAKAALQFWTDFVEKGSVSRDVVNWNQGDVANQFISGRAALGCSAKCTRADWTLG